MNEEEKIKKAMEEVSYFMKDILTDMVNSTISNIIDGKAKTVRENFDFLEYFLNTTVEIQKDRITDLVSNIFVEYLKMEPDFDIPINLIFALNDFDVVNYILVFAREKRRIMTAELVQDLQEFYLGEKQ